MHEPSQIREYYIAYLDILGYKNFFSEHEKEILSFQAKINDAIQRSKEFITKINGSPILKQSLHFETRIFSDNILLCMDVSEDYLESARAISFLQMVSDIQREFITRYGLFLRGGIKRGYISLNDDYIFGQGLIDVVEIEERKAIYPRIIIDEALVDSIFTSKLFSEEELNNFAPIENAFNSNQEISEGDKEAYTNLIFRIKMSNMLQIIALKLISKWDDGFYFVNYLQMIDSSSLLGPGTVESIKELLQSISPSDYELVSQTSNDHDSYLMQNKKRIEEQLQLYGCDKDVDFGNLDKAAGNAERREHVLKKYIWAMAYHNRFCRINNKTDFLIYTECNCDTRFLRTTITVQNYGEQEE